jgi:hypothetical protein
MSKRELIVQNIISTLQNADTIKFGLVSRDMIVLEKLSRQQFPALYITASDETRQDITMGLNPLREANLELRIVAWVSGSNLDYQRNIIASEIENVLEQDRSRGGIALKTQLTEVRTDFDIDDVYARVDISIEVLYHYSRGQA